MPNSIYLDNAATSYPKPETVYRAVESAMRSGANPGRGGHRLTLNADRLIFETREAVAELFGVSDSSRITFTVNATAAINLALFGLLQPGDRVVTTSIEHNAVTRPLRALQDRGVLVHKVQASANALVDPHQLQQACLEHPTRLLIMTHCSNVTGTVQAVEEMAFWCRKNGILLMVDGAQSAGYLPINLEKLNLDLFAAPGHKGLLGPQGTGFLYAREGVDLTPLIYGGTGGNSHSDLMPEQWPEHLECGTLNTHGLAGLKAGIEFIQQVGPGEIHRHEQELLSRLIVGLGDLDGVELFGPQDVGQRGGAVSFNLTGYDPAEVGFLLDRDHGICVRVGLHCAPDAHKTIGSFPRGTVRVSPGYFNTPGEIDHLLTAISALLAHPPL